MNKFVKLSYVLDLIGRYDLSDKLFKVAQNDDLVPFINFGEKAREIDNYNFWNDVFPVTQSPKNLTPPISPTKVKTFGDQTKKPERVKKPSIIIGRYPEDIQEYKDAIKSFKNSGSPSFRKKALQILNEVQQSEDYTEAQKQAFKAQAERINYQMKDTIITNKYLGELLAKFDIDYNDLPEDKAELNKKWVKLVSEIKSSHDNLSINDNAILNRTKQILDSHYL